MRKKSPNLNFSFSFANFVGSPDKFNKDVLRAFRRSSY